jgi:hypothetical protein
MSKEKTGMFEIRDVLKNEFQRFASINTVLKETSDGFDKIDETYETYGTEMDTSKTHLLKLKRREFFENMFIYIGFVIFFICVSYVMLKRFPLHRIIFFVYNILEMIVGYLWLSKNIVYDLILSSNKTFYNSTTNSSNTNTEF